MGLRAVVVRMIGWQVKLIAAAVLVAVIGGILWHDHYITRKLNATRHELQAANATLIAERQARAHEKEIADAAIKDLDQRRADLEDARAATPTRSVRLCRSASPAVPSSIGAALGADAAGDAGHASEAGQGVEAGPDIGTALYSLADEKDEELARCAALQFWVRSR